MTDVNQELIERLNAMERRIIELEDRDAIRLLFEAYRQHLEARDLHAFSLLFAEDGRWFGRYGNATGPENIQAMLEGTLSPNPPAPGPTVWHLAMDPIIELDGDTATAHTVYWHVRRGPDDVAEWPTLAHYDDVLTKVSGRWLFQSRESRMDIPHEVTA